MNGDQRKAGWWDVFERIAKVSSILLIPILLWGIRVEVRLAAIPAEHRSMLLEVDKVIASAVVGLPPEWVRKDLLEVKSGVDRNREAIAAMRSEMNGRLSAIETLLRNP